MSMLAIGKTFGAAHLGSRTALTFTGSNRSLIIGGAVDESMR